MGRRVKRGARSKVLTAIAVLHVEVPENRHFVDSLAPADAADERDWLIGGGDVADEVADVEWALATLARRFWPVIWGPGNHELRTSPRILWSSAQPGPDPPRRDAAARTE